MSSLFFLLTKNNTTSFPGPQFNNLQQVALFTSLVQYDKIFSKQQLDMVNYVLCGFNQSEKGKYCEWIIIIFIVLFSQNLCLKHVCILLLFSIFTEISFEIMMKMILTTVIFFKQILYYKLVVNTTAYNHTGRKFLRLLVVTIYPCLFHITACSQVDYFYFQCTWNSWSIFCLCCSYCQIC